MDSSEEEGPEEVAEEVVEEEEVAEGVGEEGAAGAGAPDQTGAAWVVCDVLALASHQ